MSVDLEGSAIQLSGNFDHPANVEWFVRHCKRLIDEQGDEDVAVRIRDIGRCFPNAEVPIAAVVDYYKHRGVNFLIDEDRWSGIHFGVRAHHPGGSPRSDRRRPDLAYLALH